MKGLYRFLWCLAGACLVLGAISMPNLSKVGKIRGLAPTHAKVNRVEASDSVPPGSKAISTPTVGAVALAKAGSPSSVSSVAQEAEPIDAISREFVLFKQTDSGEIESTDAVSREFVLFKQTDSGEIVATDAVAREFVLNRTNDSTSFVTDAIAREFVIAIADTIPPTSTITTGPREGGQIAPGIASFQWTGIDNISPQNTLVYQYRLNQSAWSEWSGATQTTTAALTVGNYVFEVRAKDQAGNIQDPPAVRNFSVDLTPPALTEIGVKDIAWDSATIYWRTNEIARGRVIYGLQATNDFRYDKDSAPDLLTYHEVRIKGLSSKTPYQYKVDLTDEAGNTSTSATLQFSTALLYDLSVQAEGITFSIPFPANNNSITMSALVRNTGDVELVGHVDFYDYRANTGPVLLGTQTITLQPYTAPTLVTSPSFVVHEHVHKPFVAVRVNRDDITSNNRADKELFVNAQPFRFTFTSPTINTWPGDVQQFTVNVQNTGTQAQTMTDAHLAGLAFANRVSPLPAEALAPGEVKQVTFEIQTPSNQAAGNLAGQLIIDGQEDYIQPLTVTVHPQPVAQLQVRLTNERTGQGIVNGIVVIGNDPRVYTTGPNGYVADGSGNPKTVPVPIGNAVVYGYAQNYMPKSGSVQIASGSNSLEIALEEGNAFQITQVTTTPLTQQQIIDRGVNLQDPQNFWVYDFVLYMEIGALPIYNVIAPAPGAGGGGFSSSFGGSGSAGGFPFEFNGVFTEQTSTWIIIPGDVRILKQFWDASVTVQNRTSAFEIQNATATLSVPSGLDLPALFGAPQPTTKQLGTIPPGENRQAIWTIRGDFPGTYRLTGQAAGNLMLGTAPIPVESTLQSEPIEVAAPSIEITFSTPASVTTNQPFDVGVHVRNTSTIDLQFVQVNIKDDKLVNCHLASARTVDLGTLMRNETKTAMFTFISHVTGIVLNVYSIITPPPLEPPITVVPGRMKILSVDDSNPSSPKIRFDCDDAEAVTARIAGRVYNLGALSEGTHEVTLSNLDTVAPGLHQLEIDGLFQGAHLIDSATLDSRFINAATTNGLTTFTVNGAAKSLDYRGTLIVRRWEWNVGGGQYSRMVVGADASLTTNLTPLATKQASPQVSLLPPLIGTIGSGGLLSVIPTSVRGGPLAWSARTRNVKIFANPGVSLSVRVTGSYGPNPWVFGGSSQFSYALTTP